MKIKDLVRPHLLAVKAYSSARDEYSGSEGTFLDANENPYGSTSEGAWNRYPDPYQRKLKLGISELKKAPVENIFIGAGSDEPIDLIIRAFCNPGEDEILIFPPTYGMYEVSADIHNVRVNKINLKSNFQLDRSKIESVLHPKIKVIFVCTPNNPTGNEIANEDILHLMDQAPGLVVIDEAYIDFSATPSFLHEIERRRNVVVLQTLSKAWGLASLRLGIAFADHEVIKILNLIKPPYNISGPVQDQAFEAITKNEERKNRWVWEILEEKRRIIPELQKISMVEEIHESATNFLLVRFKRAAEVFQYLMDKKVIVRDRSKHPLCDNCLRITIGTLDENLYLLDQLKLFEQQTINVS